MLDVFQRRLRALVIREVERVDRGACGKELDQFQGARVRDEVFRQLYMLHRGLGISQGLNQNLHVLVCEILADEIDGGDGLILLQLLQVELEALAETVGRFVLRH